MAPRKTRRSTSESNEGLVAETIDYDQIEYYKKQIVLLQTELETCKSQILELQSENQILKNANIKAINNDAVKISINQRNLSKMRNNKVLSPSPVTKSKGCSCKGNCSSKICGCVKKGILCQEFCRCNDVHCQNQEPDKENIEQASLTSDGHKALEKLGSLTLNQESLHASEKKIKKSIFSPYVGRSFHNGSQEIYPASPLVFETRRKLFSQDSDDVVDVDVNTSEHEKDELAKKLESQQESTTIKQVKNPESMDSKEMKTVPQSEKDTKKNKKSKQLPVKNSKPAIVVHNDQEDEVFVSDEQSKIRKSPRLLRRKSKSTSPDCNVAKRKYDKATIKVKSKSVSPKESVATKNNSENHQPKLGKVQHSPQLFTKQTITCIKKVENIDNKNDKLTNKVQIEISQENSVVNSKSFESNNSGDTSNSSNHNDLIDSSINPMVPKRQLARSPITAGTVIVTIDKKRFSPPPKKELAAEEVDWEQHQSELVQCTKCKRRFWPHRLDTHFKSCKGT